MKCNVTFNYNNVILYMCMGYMYISRHLIDQVQARVNTLRMNRFAGTAWLCIYWIPNKNYIILGPHSEKLRIALVSGGIIGKMYK